QNRLGAVAHAVRSRQAIPAFAGTSLAHPTKQGKSAEVEPIEAHHLVPGSREVFHELLLRVRGPIDFRERAQLRVRTEDQVDPRAGPLDRVRLSVAPFVDAGSEVGWV